jgi:hypothetical protein
MVSPEIQRQNIQRVCDAHGWTPEWHEDVEGHKSAMHENNRPGWLALKTRLGDPDVVALVANDLSRLHRKGWRITDLLDFVDQHHIRLVLADPAKQIDLDTPQGRIFAHLSAVFDEWYAVDMSIRQKANIAYRKSKQITVGLPPFGTRRNAEGYLTPTSEGAWWLPDGTWQAGQVGDSPPHPKARWRGYYECAEQVLRMYADGYHRADICRRLTREGYAFRGRDGKPTLLEADDVRRITHNWVEYGGAVLDKHASNRHYEKMDLSVIPLSQDRAVFPLGLLRAVARQIVKHSSRHKDGVPAIKREEPSVYALSGLVYCAHCEGVARQQENGRLRSRLLVRSRGKYYVHRPGINCGRYSGQVSRQRLERDFLDLIRQLTVNEKKFGTMMKLAGETSTVFGDEAMFEKRRTAAIDKCRRKIKAALHLYKEGELSAEDYLKRKAEAEQEIAHWQAYSAETHETTMQLMVCMEAIGKLAELWQVVNEEDRNRMARSMFAYIVYDLDQQRIVDFRLQPAVGGFLVFREEGS